MRNKVLDLLRGHYLLAILIDHLHMFPSPFFYYNGRGDLWVSAAAGFVFVSGMLLGVVNFPKIESKGFKYVTSKLLKRGIRLHLIGVFLTLIYSLLGNYLGSSPYLGQGILYTNPFEILFNALIFKYSYGWADLLIFYAILILISPTIMYLIYKKLWKLVLSISIGLWLYALITPGVNRISGSYFPVISWQLMFFSGMIAGYYKPKLASLYRQYFVSARIIPQILLCFSFLFTVILSYLNVFYGKSFGLDPIVISAAFNKIELGPGRVLLFFLWFVFFYWLFHKFYPYISKYLGWLYFTLGKNSLLTYIVQSLVLFASFYFLKPGGYLYNTFWTIWVVALVWSIVILLKTRYFAWIKI